jgi:hypothetical protein
MVALYVDGNKVGTLADAEGVMRKLIGQKTVVEVRSETTGWTLGTLTPEPICPWEPDLTSEELERRIAEPGAMTLAEFRKQAGW